LFGKSVTGYAGDSIVFVGNTDREEAPGRKIFENLLLVTDWTHKEIDMLRKLSIEKASTHEFIRCWPEDTLGDIHKKICEHNSIVVMDSNGCLQGIISRKDVVGVIISHSEWKDIPVSKIMNRKILYIPNNVSLADAAEIMLKTNIHQLVVTGSPEGGSVAIGMVTLQDILKNAI
jgi:signal-transduction protein with cAMP-binding, CBS, and nucleotidyltransferase domain